MHSTQKIVSEDVKVDGQAAATRTSNICGLKITLKLHLDHCLNFYRRISV